VSTTTDEIKTPDAPPAPGGRPTNELRAFLALAKASLLGQVRNFSTLFFGFLFPIVFIAIFGFLGNATTKVTLGVAPGTDTQSPVYQALTKIPAVTLQQGDQATLDSQLKKGQIDAIIYIVAVQRPAQPSQNGAQPAQPTAQPTQGYDVTLTTSTASVSGAATATALVNGVASNVNLALAGVTVPAVQVTTSNITGQKYTYIDFALPGQLGFSLLSIAIFGTAFGFVVLKRTLVLKRIFATPTRPRTLVLGQGASRLVIATAQVIVILLVGVFFFSFHLANGVTTFLEMLALCLFGLIVFLGMGLIVAGNFNNENTMGPVINLITLPQFLLSGTFFSTSNFPDWLQPIANNLPLSYLNVALRQVASDGATLWDVRGQILGLLIWGVISYVIAIVTFKWE
jgi:ABC-2 type transport system permease protein